jgi:hypothetical protein
MGDQLAGFRILIRSGRSIMLSSCGIDYAHADTAAAYFNLSYEAIRIAASAQLNVIDWGTTTYEFKRRLGCTRFPTWYLVDFRTLFLRRIGPWLVKSYVQRCAAQ